jgi:hypothetical protein
MNSKKTKLTIWAVISQIRLKVILFSLIGFAAFAAFIGIEVTSQSGFCNSCHIMNDYYASWEKSTHSDVECLKCHLQPGFTNYLVGKINGLAQSVDCMVGRVGTQAEATVFDVSCLRSACHSVDQLLEEEILFGSVKFTHKGHIQETFDGIDVSCSTCHSHYQGDEHFSVQKEICFSCHFIKIDQGAPGIVKSQCLDCHNIPEKVIERGLVKVDHQEFASYEASCEDSCHKRQVEHVSNVSDTSCLQCHSFGRSPDDTSEHLHASHTEKEKVECFACHGKVVHGPDKTSSIATMINCENCHSDTHGAQATIFSADQKITHDQENEKLLSPMFMTHVECTGCHIESTSSETGALNSLGAVARAVPRACDTCHESGTGQRYIPFWQKNIKNLYQQVLEKTDSLERKLTLLNGSEGIGEYADPMGEVRSILESVRSDGSWGVHNLKYTEAILLKAKKILSDIESGKK